MPFLKKRRPIVIRPLYPSYFFWTATMFVFFLLRGEPTFPETRFIYDFTRFTDKITTYLQNENTDEITSVRFIWAKIQYNFFLFSTPDIQ